MQTLATYALRQRFELCTATRTGFGLLRHRNTHRAHVSTRTQRTPLARPTPGWAPGCAPGEASCTRPCGRSSSARFGTSRCSSTRSCIASSCRTRTRWFLSCHTRQSSHAGPCSLRKDTRTTHCRKQVNRQRIGGMLRQVALGCAAYCHLRCSERTGHASSARFENWGSATTIITCAPRATR